MDRPSNVNIASVLAKSHARLPLLRNAPMLLEWGAGGHTILLRKGEKGGLVLSFAYGDVEGFTMIFGEADEGYAMLDALFDAPEEHAPRKPEYIKKVIAVFMFYHGNMKRAKEM